MSISPGYTNQEITELVHTYDSQRHGTRGQWLKDHDLTHDRMRRWRRAVYDGDLDIGLIPREGSSVQSTNPNRRATAHSEAAKSRRISQLEARIAELEATNTSLTVSNEALGKAIGLLHEITAPESDKHPTTLPPIDS